MATAAIDQLTAAASVLTTDLIELERTGSPNTSLKATISQLVTLLNTLYDAAGAAATAQSNAESYAASQAAAAQSAAESYADGYAGSAAGTSGKPLAATDASVTNARTPTAHASSHESGGSDALALDTLGAPTDNTNLNVSTSAHGLAPKLPGSSSEYLDGTGAWSTPSGGGGGGVAIGGTVSGGTASYVLFVDGSGNLGQSSKLVFDGTTLTVGTSGTGGVQTVLNNGSSAAYFQNNTQIVAICDGTNHITYTPANSSNWSGSAPTDVWVALDRLAAACVAAGQTP